MTAVDAIARRTASARTTHNRQVVVVLLVLLAYNGFVCWLNTLQHTHPFLALVTLVGNYVLLGLWIGTLATAGDARPAWGTAVVLAAIMATHADVYLQRPELLRSIGAWGFWLANVGEVAMVVALVASRLRMSRPAPSVVTERGLAPVVPLPTRTAPAQVRDAA